MSNDTQIKESAPSGHAKRRIRNLLIDSRFQLRWVVRVIFIITVIVFVMGYFLYLTVAEATDQMLAQKLGDLNLTEASIQAFVRQAEVDKSVTIYKLVAWLVTLAVFVSGATIVLTHKVAGPVYKMRTIFRSISDENLHLSARLRKGDELKEAFEDFDDMLRRMRDQRRTDLESLQKIRDRIAAQKDAKPELSEIDALIEKYRRSVQPDSAPPSSPTG
jgi:nitrogen fixation/metabolism regulation signal transduction histidine kinase